MYSASVVDSANGRCFFSECNDGTTEDEHISEYQPPGVWVASPVGTGVDD